jgi:hypothetical protein
MLEFIDTAFQWLLYGLKGIGGLVAVTGVVAVGGAVAALAVAIVSQIIFWPIYILKRSRKTLPAVE